MPQSGLQKYRTMRSAGATPEPFDRLIIPATGKLFVVQQHQARALHWDFRLEFDGVLKSWAVPKGPSNDPTDKRFAAQVEDHPLDYADFEGRIPEGNYGAGFVIVWDRGTWSPIGDVTAGLSNGKLLFDLRGYKLRGRWTLVRMGGRKKPDARDWLLIKERDDYADVDTAFGNESVLSGLTVEGLADPRPTARAIVRALKRTGAPPVDDPAPPLPQPMLARAGQAFDSPDWVFELKYDGYRLIAEKSPEQLRLVSRNGNDLTRLFPEIAQSLSHWPVDHLVVDGEVVVLNDQGVPDFSKLQQRAALSSDVEVARAAIEQPACYFAFDLLQLQSTDLTSLPLETRKRLLARVIPPAGAIRFSTHIRTRGRDTYQAAINLGMEGIVAKRFDSTYTAGRSDHWIKVRSRKTGDFVVCGWIANRSNARDIGALALGEFRRGELHYVGRVGSGLSGSARRDLARALAKLDRGRRFAPHNPPATSVNWVRPELVCEVAFREYTAGGHLRQPVFVRLRADKSAAECIGRMDDPDAVLTDEGPLPDVTITHPDKIFFPEKALSKGDLVAYYRGVAEWMLPYLHDRPVVLTRFPDGIHGKSFYQRDAPDYTPEWLQRAVLWSDGAEREVSYFVIQHEAALAYIANMGAIVIHMWHSRIDDLEHPDWCVLDLDPKSAPFAHVLAVARALGELAEEVGLPAYLKTSGASGLHVLIPLARQLTHEQSRTLAELLGRVIVQRLPDIATMARAVRHRDGKVYVDFLQNGHGRLLAAPFSVRAEPAASVSMPVRWHEATARLTNERFHITNAIRRLRRGGDPMASILEARPDLHAALTALAQRLDESGEG